MISGCVVAAAAVLAVAGVAKVAKPQVTAEAIRGARLPASDAAVTVLGAAELLLGVVVVVWQPRLATALLGLLYLGFTAFSLRLLISRGPEASCGCFGQRDARIGIEHIVVNLVVAAASFAVVADGGSPTSNAAVAVVATIVLLVLLAGVPTLRARR